MKIFIYSCRQDERPLFEQYAKKWNLSLDYCPVQPGSDNWQLAKGHEAISVVGTRISDEILRHFAEEGVRMISCRCIGLDHLNVSLAEQLGMKVTNITYSPNAVADYAIMLMLMCLRKEKYILERYAVHDYSLACNRGRELRDMTVGIVGGGRIGRTVMEEIRGFGCRFLVYDKYERDDVREYASYVSFEDLLQQSDLISFHAPGTAETHHMLNMDTVKLLKPGAIIVNTSRGSNIDNKALIYGIENGIISAAGLDVIDHEPEVYNIDHKDAIPTDHDVAVLESFPNVIITPHTAFFTDHAVRDMIEHALENICSYFDIKTE